MRIESSILSPEELHKELCIIYRKAIEIESKRKGKPIFEMNLGLNFVFYPVPKSTDIKPYLVNVFLCHPYDSGNVIEDIYARIEIVGYDGVFDKDTPKRDIKQTIRSGEGDLYQFGRYILPVEEFADTMSTVRNFCIVDPDDLYELRNMSSDIEPFRVLAQSYMDKRVQQLSQ